MQNFLSTIDWTREQLDGLLNLAMELVELGEHCSMTERRADDATRDVMRWLKAEYMVDRIGEEFDGTVSGVTGFGLFVQLDDVYIDGLGSGEHTIEIWGSTPGGQIANEIITFSKLL